jgi:hypothetical protein
MWSTFEAIKANTPSWQRRYSLPSPSPGHVLKSITLFTVGAPSEPGSNLNTCTKLEPEDLLLETTMNPELLGESTPP